MPHRYTTARQLLQRRHFIQTLGALATGLAQPGLALAQGLGQGNISDFWSLLRAGGCVVLMRHAQTVPGVGDPPGWRLGDCSSQRKLSEAGREQARRVGAAFRREGVRVDEVRSSAWCRCTDTADLAFGRHTLWAPLNSFFQAGDGAAQTQALQAELQPWQGPRNLVLVTHQVNMSTLTGEYPAMGELFLLRPSGHMPDQTQGRWPVLARQLL